MSICVLVPIYLICSSLFPALLVLCCPFVFPFIHVQGLPVMLYVSLFQLFAHFLFYFDSWFSLVSGFLTVKYMYMCLIPHLCLVSRLCMYSRVFLFVALPGLVPLCVALIHFFTFFEGLQISVSSFY